MNKIISVLKIVILSAIGLLQVLLLIFGAWWAEEHFGDTFPFIKDLGIFIAFLSLIYPVYIIIAFDRSRIRKKETASNQQAQPIAGKPGSG